MIGYSIYLFYQSHRNIKNNYEFPLSKSMNQFPSSFSFPSFQYQFPFQNMQSRTRKNLRCENDSEAIIRQLQNDFQVFEYLKENKLETTNIEEYARLYNCLIAEQQERKGAYNRLQAEFQQLKEKQLDSDEQIIQKRVHTLDLIQEKTCKEMDISNDLEKEIVQTKKSLNLLKGDIGHLVSRNESAKLLSSKISKVKIVAEDQLKRVTLAYIKDKQEIKLRNEMQKKFSKKLKNVSNYQNNSLARLKKNYAEIQLKKQDIFEKLMASRKISQNEEQAEMLKYLKYEKDEQNQQQLDELLRLAKVTNEFTIAKLASLTLDPNELVNQITTYYQSIPELAGRDDEVTQVLNDAVNQILDQYHKIEESIKAQSQFYQELLIVRKENKDKLTQFQKEEGELAKKFKLELEETYKIDQQSQNSYQSKLKQFGEVLSALFALLSYLQKNIQFQNYYPLQHKFFSFEKQEQSQNGRKSIIQIKQQPIYYNYISCLHRVNQLLSTTITNQCLNFSADKHEQEMNDFYNALLEDVKLWFADIKKRFTDKYLEQMIGHRNSRNSVSRYSIFGNSRRTTHFKKESGSFHQEQQEIQENQKEQINLLTEHCNQSSCYAKSPSTTSMPHSTKQSIKAKRIKLLEGIDIDYYKMIKSTIKMEKENTRKNYQFLRTFKRAKYASRDNILEEKRFESSFSVLFTKQSVPNLAKTSKLDNSSTGFTRCNEVSKNRSFFKKSTNKLNNSSGTSSPNLEGKPVISKSSIQDPAIRRSRMTEKLKLAMQFI